MPAPPPFIQRASVRSQSFHGCSTVARRATPCISIGFPLFPVFRGCEKGNTETGLIARTPGTKNIGNTLKAFAGIWEQTGNRTGNTGNN